MKAIIPTRPCDACRTEYRPIRIEQTFCSPRCRRDAAYAREQLKIGKRPKRRLEKLPKNVPATPLPGSFRKRPNKPKISVGCKRPLPCLSGPVDVLGSCR